jgi:methyl-accepting chemotaxis protein
MPNIHVILNNEAGQAGEAIKELSLAIEKSAKMAIQISTSTKQQMNAMNELVRSVQLIKVANRETSARFREAGL